MAAGDLDLTFDTDGKVTTDFGVGSVDQAYAVALAGSGRIAVAGSTNDGSNLDFAVARYASNGGLDATFDTDGKVTTAIGSSNETAYGVAIQADGAMVVAGEADMGGPSSFDFAVVRYTSTGALDTSFGGDGIVTTDFGSSVDRGYAVALQADGKIVVAGLSGFQVAMVRYNVDGLLETAFGTGGKVTTSFGGTEAVANSVAMHSDGNIVIAGYTFDSGTPKFAVARYTSTGVLDTTFDGDGLVVTPFSGSSAAYSIAVQSNGQLVVAGRAANRTNDDFALARYNSDGSLDSAFGTGGKVTTPIGASNETALSVAVQQDGKIVAVGNAYTGATNEFAIVRYLSNGSLDTAFSTDGIVTTAIGTSNSVARGVVLQSDHKIVAAGGTNTAAGGSDFALARYDAGTVGTLSPALAGGTLTINDIDPVGNVNNLTVALSGANLAISSDQEVFTGTGGIAGATLSLDEKTLFVPFASVTSLIVNTGAGNDSLTVDLTTGDANPSGGITFNGGGQIGIPGDSLAIVGGNQGNVTYNYSSAHNGSIELQNFGTVNYTGLEPISNTGTSANVVFNLSGADDEAKLSDIGGGTLRLESTAATPTFERTDFAKPTGTITINGDTSAALLNLLGTFDFMNIAGEMDVDSLRNYVYISGGMGQQGLIRVNTSNPAAMTETPLSDTFGGGVAVDPITGRYATTNGGTVLRIFNPDGSVFDTESLTGCGGSLAAGTGTFGISTQCNDHFAVYNPSSMMLNTVVGGPVGSRVTYNAATATYYWNRNQGPGAISFSESPPAKIADINGIYFSDANPVSNRVYATNTAFNQLYVLDGGTLAVTATINGPIGDVAVDTANDRLYFVSGSTIQIYNGEGTAPLGSFAMPGGYVPSLIDMAVGDNRLYVIAGKTSFPNRLFALQTGATSGNDALTLDLTSGDPLPASGFTFNGSGGTDTLSILGTGSQNPTCTPNSTTANRGILTLTTIGARSVAFDTSEAVEFRQLGTVTVSLPNANDTVNIANTTLLDGVTAALAVTGNSGGVGFADARIRGSNIAINTTTSDGNDMVTIASANNAHANTGLSINTGSGTDTVAVNGAVAMSGSISVASPTIQLGANLSTSVAAAAGSLTLTGAVSLTATTVLSTDSSTSDGSIQITGTVNGAHDLTFVAGGGDIAVSGAIGGTGPLSSLVISSADDTTFSSTLRTTGNVTQLAGSGTTAFAGTSGAGIGGNLSVNANAITFDAAASTVGGSVNLTAANGMAFNDSAGLTAMGTITLLVNNDNGGPEGFAQAAAATIQTSNTGPSAFSLTVRGTGSALLSGIQTGTNGRATIAVGGAITDNNGDTVNITAGMAALTAVLGIGSGNSLETSLGVLGMLAAINSGSNAISVDNSGAGELTVGTVGTLSGIRNTMGTSITVVNDGPLTIADDVIAAGEITLTANDTAGSGDNLTVHGADTAGTGTVEITAGGAVLLNAGDNLTLNATSTVTAVGSAAFVGDFNSDGGETPTTTMTLAGAVSVTGGAGGPLIMVTAGAGNDTVTLTGTYTATGGSMRVSAGDGADTVTLNTSDSGGFASLTVEGGLGNDQITMTNLPSSIVSGQIVTLKGGDGNDTLTGQVGVNAFVVNGINAGTLNHVTSGPNITNPAIQFETIENLKALAAADSFLMETDGSLDGSIDGGEGVDLLSYVNRTSAVTVNLLNGTSNLTAESIMGGITMKAANDSTIENLTGGGGDDSLTGDIDENTILGNAGDDTINAKAGNDSVNGGAGSDQIDIESDEAEFDTMIGGTGLSGDATDYDSLVNIGNTTVTLDTFNITFDSFANSIDLYDGNNQSLQGNGGSNTLQFGFTRVINFSTRTISGSSNDDVVTSAYDNSGATTYDGQGHNSGDTVYIVLVPFQFDLLTDSDITTLNSYIASPSGQSLMLQVDDPGDVYDLEITATNFEAARIAVYDDGLILDITTCFSNIRAAAQILTGSDDPDVSDTIDGTSLTDLIFGQRGDDTIRGLAGNDCVFGGAGADTLFGQDGDDLLVGGSGGDMLYGGVNNDRLLGASGNDSLFGEAGDDQLDGGADNDFADGGADNDLVVGNTGNDSLFGDLGFDILQGGEGADYLSGGMHDDVLNGGLGDDMVLGGDGYNTIQVASTEAVNDVMLGGPNTDTIATVGGGPVAINNFNAAAASIEVWNGGGYAIFGTSGNNILDFSAMTFSGVVYVDGRAGDDRITGTGGADELRGGEGNDTLIGLGGVDILRGYAGDDSLNGGGGVDYLFGGFGADTLSGGDGRDILYFAYDDALTDTVTDFALYSDTLSFRDYRPTYSWTYASLAFATMVPGTRDVILPTAPPLSSNKRIRLLGWTSNVASTQVRFT